MMNLLNKSIQLRRFHVAILIIIVSLIGWGLTRYMKIIRTEFNQVVFSTSISNIQSMLTSNSLLNRGSDPTCHFLDNPGLFRTESGLVPVLNTYANHEDLKPGSWHYDATHHRLIFNIKPSQYFQSDAGSQIWVNFICKKGAVTINISPYQLCQEMQLRGCSHDP